MKKLDVTPSIGSVLDVLKVGEPRSFGGLTVVPLLLDGAAEPDWLLLDEALAAGTLEVGEVSHQGAVPSLVAGNTGNRPVLLLDGEELVGAKQNRILNTSLLVGAGVKMEIPVSCVEAGRWHYRSRRFSSSERSVYASIRRMKSAQVLESLKKGRRYRSDQGQIWDGLAAKAASLRFASPTDAMGDVFEARALDLEQYREAFPPQPGQVGAAIYGGPAWWGLDVLAGPSLFRRAWRRLLTGYAMDAITGRNDGAPKERAETRLAALKKARTEVFPAAGLGEDHRLQGDGVQGAALVVGGTVAHLMAFPA